MHLLRARRGSPNNQMKLERWLEYMKRRRIRFLNIGKLINYFIEKENRKTVKAILEIDKQTHLLNNWERKFVHSVKGRIDDGRRLSAKQEEKLTEIMHRIV